MLLTNSTPETLDSHRPPLGVEVDLPDEPVESTHQLAAGDRVFLASDGLPEALDGDGAQLGLERVRSIISDRSATSEEVVDRLVMLQRAHSGGPSQTDDVTVMCIDRL